MSPSIHHLSKVPPHGKELFVKSVAAVGVVYGDIGTSPLYALRECFSAHHGVSVIPENIVGIVSLFCWSLICVIVIKYLIFMLRADNEGEGGILALLALTKSRRKKKLGKKSSRVSNILILAGLFGAALLYGDGMITPAISVLSAVEGLSVVTPHHPGLLTPYIRWITIGILLGLFLLQERGTHRVGALFGPIMIVWFVCIAVGALPWIWKHPEILNSFDPRHGINFLFSQGYLGFLVLGSVVLCITGGEALYADMGHFGPRPIRLAWYAIVFPALVTNYLGQGARLLEMGAQGTSNAFFGMFPGWALIPIVIIATVATIVASQALISGAFSLSRQAVQLGYSPRLTIIHTSEDQEGEIYVPEINWLLMISCIALVLGFGSSTRLAAAYGIAVTGTMLITSILYFAAMKDRIGKVKLIFLVSFFMIFDVSFLSANLVKFTQGGWFPLLIGGILFGILTTWKQGRQRLYESIRKKTMPLTDFLEDMDRLPPLRVEGTAIFMTSNPDGAPPILLHHIKHNKVLHEQVILLSIITEHVPEVEPKDRITIQELGLGMYQVSARYGFMQTPNVREILRRCQEAGIEYDLASTTFYLGRETLLSRGDTHMLPWRKNLFAFLSRNARPATHFFNIPSDRVVEIGMQIQL